jgi:hypothetical protein
MSNALPRSIANYLETPTGRAAVDAATIWFRWNSRTERIEASGAVLKATPEQMSRPGSSVYLRVIPGGWKRYC